MSIIKHVTSQKIVAHDFRYDPRRFFEIVHPWLTECRTVPPTSEHRTTDSMLRHSEMIAVGRRAVSLVIFHRLTCNLGTECPSVTAGTH